MMIPIVAAIVLIAAVSARGWAAITLMHRYDVEDYLADSNARRLYWIAALTPLVAVTAIVVLAGCTHLWWVEAAAALFFVGVAAKSAWAIRMRLSGEYRVSKILEKR